MRVGVLEADLHIPEARSLKDKRRVIRSLKDRIFSRFNASVSEVDAEDVWQRATIGVAIAGDDAPHLDAQLQKIEAFIRQHPGAIPLRIETAIQDVEW